MNVVFICDKNYLIPTKVSINSLISNKGAEDKLNIYVIGVELRLQDFSSFDVFQSEKVHIKIIIPEQSFQQINISHWYVSKAALYKMKIPDLLSDLDRALYIDSDILVLKSLIDLYNIDLKKYYAAVVGDMEAESWAHMHEKINVKHYFNSGMMLLNLAAIRNDGVVQKLICDREHDKTNYFMDQNTFNRVFAPNVIFIQPEYNYMQTINNFSLEERADFFGVTKSEMKKMQSDPTILHLTNKEKPWNSANADNAKLWFSYLSDSDREKVLSDLIKSEKHRADVLLKELNSTKLELQKYKLKFEFVMDQYFDDYQYRKSAEFAQNKKIDCLDAEKWVIENKEKLKQYFENEKRSIIIYGAGRVGRAIFKLLTEFGMQESILGFAVNDLKTNLSEIFFKKVELLNKYENKGTFVIIAIKSKKDDYSDIEEIIELLQHNGFYDFLDVNELFKKCSNSNCL